MSRARLLHFNSCEDLYLLNECIHYSISIYYHYPMYNYNSISVVVYDRYIYRSVTLGMSYVIFMNNHFIYIIYYIIYIIYIIYIYILYIYIYIQMNKVKINLIDLLISYIYIYVYTRMASFSFRP